MKPYYEHGGVTIYHGDCREVLPLIRGDVEEAAEAAAATFPGDVSGEAAVALESAPLGSALQPDVRADSGGPLARHLRRGDGESVD